MLVFKFAAPAIGAPYFMADFEADLSADFLADVSGVLFLCCLYAGFELIRPVELPLISLVYAGSYRSYLCIDGLPLGCCIFCWAYLFLIICLSTLEQLMLVLLSGSRVLNSRASSAIECLLSRTGLILLNLLLSLTLLTALFKSCRMSSGRFLLASSLTCRYAFYCCRTPL